MQRPKANKTSEGDGSITPSVEWSPNGNSYLRLVVSVHEVRRISPIELLPETLVRMSLQRGSFANGEYFEKERDMNGRGPFLLSLSKVVGRVGLDDIQKRGRWSSEKTCGIVRVCAYPYLQGMMRNLRRARQKQK